MPCPALMQVSATWQVRQPSPLWGNHACSCEFTGEAGKGKWTCRSWLHLHSFLPWHQAGAWFIPRVLSLLLSHPNLLGFQALYLKVSSK